MALPKFGKLEVVKSRIRITGAGDGLSDALDIEPVALAHGDTEYYVLRAEVVQVNHVFDKADEAKLDRVHSLKVVGITTIPAEVAAEIIDNAMEALAEAQAKLGAEEAAKQAKERGEEPLFGDE